MKRLITFVLLCLFLLAPAAFASTDSCLAILTPYADQVNDAGLYPSVMLAQQLLETGHCRSEAVQYNNFWGIKCRDGICFSKKTWEVYSGKVWQGELLFQIFDSPGDAVAGYCRKILWQPAYSDVNYDSRDEYIDSLAAVWATDQHYAVKLKGIIERYGLTKYDERE